MGQRDRADLCLLVAPCGERAEEIAQRRAEGVTERRIGAIQEIARTSQQ